MGCPPGLRECHRKLNPFAMPAPVRQECPRPSAPFPAKKAFGRFEPLCFSAIAASRKRSRQLGNRYYMAGLLSDNGPAANPRGIGVRGPGQKS